MYDDDITEEEAQGAGLCCLGLLAVMGWFAVLLGIGLYYIIISAARALV